uniref:Tetratricopeptide repeat-containing protein n=1 Tax=Chromera velia CCMP2878 TaxID=1169474 RepID=A0A0G4F9C7_9ALVE|eukprot:Cvel_2966.t1-p1 / transcript=Cvel_2966.t1 / gene=Cvel_2966 / organism=Chromera_velia_CCMP2878 / gene_product=hypothetical protein / transcript_product=hypothetical protein / location=Cvel_scaffold117:116096-126000(-) / protein_length=1914 / sequence_SO=supercontig / SO=protein_coding / is_pseudo=false
MLGPQCVSGSCVWGRGGNSSAPLRRLAQSSRLLRELPPSSSSSSSALRYALLWVDRQGLRRDSWRGACHRTAIPMRPVRVGVLRGGLSASVPRSRRPVHFHSRSISSSSSFGDHFQSPSIEAARSEDLQAALECYRQSARLLSQGLVLGPENDQVLLAFQARNAAGLASRAMGNYNESADELREALLSCSRRIGQHGTQSTIVMELTGANCDSATAALLARAEHTDTLKDADSIFRQCLHWVRQAARGQDDRPLAALWHNFAELYFFFRRQPTDAREALSRVRMCLKNTKFVHETEFFEAINEGRESVSTEEGGVTNSESVTSSLLSSVPLEDGERRQAEGLGEIGREMERQRGGAGNFRVDLSDLFIREGDSVATAKNGLSGPSGVFGVGRYSSEGFESGLHGYLSGGAIRQGQRPSIWNAVEGGPADELLALPPDYPISPFDILSKTLHRPSSSFSSSSSAASSSKHDGPVQQTDDGGNKLPPNHHQPSDEGAARGRAAPHAEGEGGGEKERGTATSRAEAQNQQPSLSEEKNLKESSAEKEKRQPGQQGHKQTEAAGEALSASLRPLSVPPSGLPFLDPSALAMICEARCGAALYWTLRKALQKDHLQREREKESLSVSVQRERESLHFIQERGREERTRGPPPSPAALLQQQLLEEERSRPAELGQLESESHSDSPTGYQTVVEYRLDQPMRGRRSSKERSLFRQLSDENLLRKIIAGMKGERAEGVIGEKKGGLGVQSDGALRFLVIERVDSPSSIDSKAEETGAADRDTHLKSSSGDSFSLSLSQQAAAPSADSGLDRGDSSLSSSFVLKVVEVVRPSPSSSSSSSVSLSSLFVPPSSSFPSSRGERGRGGRGKAWQTGSVLPIAVSLPKPHGKTTSSSPRPLSTRIFPASSLLKLDSVSAGSEVNPSERNAEEESPPAPQHIVQRYASRKERDDSVQAHAGVSESPAAPQNGGGREKSPSVSGGEHLEGQSYGLKSSKKRGVGQRESRTSTEGHSSAPPSNSPQSSSSQASSSSTHVADPMTLLWENLERVGVRPASATFLREDSCQLVEQGIKHLRSRMTVAPSPSSPSFKASSTSEDSEARKEKNRQMGKGKEEGQEDFASPLSSPICPPSSLSPSLLSSSSSPEDWKAGGGKEERVVETTERFYWDGLRGKEKEAAARDLLRSAGSTRAVIEAANTLALCDRPGAAAELLSPLWGLLLKVREHRTEIMSRAKGEGKGGSLSARESAQTSSDVEGGHPGPARPYAEEAKTNAGPFQRGGVEVPPHLLVPPPRPPQVLPSSPFSIGVLQQSPSLPKLFGQSAYAPTPNAVAGLNNLGVTLLMNLLRHPPGVSGVTVQQGEGGGEVQNGSSADALGGPSPSPSAQMPPAASSDWDRWESACVDAVQAVEAAGEMMRGLQKGADAGGQNHWAVGAESGSAMSSTVLKYWEGALSRNLESAQDALGLVAATASYHRQWLIDSSPEHEQERGEGRKGEVEEEGRSVFTSRHPECAEGTREAGEGVQSSLESRSTSGETEKKEEASDEVGRRSESLSEKERVAGEEDPNNSRGPFGFLSLFSHSRKFPSPSPRTHASDGCATSTSPPHSLSLKERQDSSQEADHNKKGSPREEVTAEEIKEFLSNTEASELAVTGERAEREGEWVPEERKGAARGREGRKHKSSSRDKREGCNKEEDKREGRNKEEENVTFSSCDPSDPSSSSAPPFFESPPLSSSSSPSSSSMATAHGAALSDSPTHFLFEPGSPLSPLPPAPLPLPPLVFSLHSATQHLGLWDLQLRGERERSEESRHPPLDPMTLRRESAAEDPFFRSPGSNPPRQQPDPSSPCEGAAREGQGGGGQEGGTEKGGRRRSRREREITERGRINEVPPPPPHVLISQKNFVLSVLSQPLFLEGLALQTVWHSRPPDPFGV